MKRYTLFIVSLLLIVIIFVLTTGQSAAGPKFPVTETKQTICFRGLPDRIWLDEHTGHGRDMHQDMIAQSLDSRFAGEGHDTVNWNVNFTTMKGVSWGDFEIVNPKGVWRGTWQGEITPAWPQVIGVDGVPIWLFDGRGVGHGFGEYHGLQKHITIHQSVFVYPTEEAALLEVPCVTGGTADGQVYVLQNDNTVYVTGRVKE